MNALSTPPIWALTAASAELGLADILSIRQTQTVPGDNHKPTPRAQEDRKGFFPTTHWSKVLQGEEGVAAELTRLLDRYRTALMFFLRRWGCPENQIEDVVQAFYEALIKKESLEKVSRERGKFRTFLLAALRNFLRDWWKHENAGIRGGGLKPDSLDELSSSGFEVHDPNLPDLGKAYDKTWAHTVLKNALSRLRQEYGPKRERLCAALEPSLFGDNDAKTYQELGSKLDMTEGAVKVAATRMRQRLKELIRDEVRQTLDNPDDLEVEDEIRYLISLLDR